MSPKKSSIGQQVGQQAPFNAGKSAITMGLAASGATSSAGSLTAATLIPGALTLGLTLAGKQPFKPPVANPIFGTAENNMIFNALPGNPGYKGAQFRGGQPTGKTMAQGAEIGGLEAKQLKQIDIPESIRGNYRKEQAYKDGHYQLESIMREKFGIRLPRGTLYPHYKSVTRYSDEAHGSKPITYQNKGPEGEVVIKELAGGLGLTNLGRVLHGPRHKWGVPIDIGGEKTVAIRTGIYAKRAFQASSGKLDPQEVFQMAKERAEREVEQELQEVKPKTVAWGRHDNPIDPKTAQQLMRATEPKQAVWNQAENEWQDANLGLKVDQKAARERWQATRPAVHKDDKPNNRSVVNMTTELASKPPAKTDAGATHTKPLTKEDSPVSFTDERREAFAANRGNPAGTHKPKSTTDTSGSVLPHERGQGHKPLSSSSSNASTTKTTRITDDHWRSGGGGAHQPGNVIKPINLGWGNAATASKDKTSPRPDWISGSTADQITASVASRQETLTAPAAPPEISASPTFERTSTVSPEVAQAANLTITDITDLSGPTQIFEAPKVGTPPTEIFPIDPGQNISRGRMGMY